MNDWTSECGVEKLGKNRVGNCRVEEHSNIAAVTVVVEIVSGQHRSVLRRCSGSGVVRSGRVGHSMMSVTIDGG